MSTVQASTVLPVRAMEVLVKGKLVESRRVNDLVYSTIVAPAVDEFSSPSTVEVRSKKRFGEREEIVTVRCRLGGFRGRPFKATDKETGEMRTARTVVLTLDAIE